LDADPGVDPFNIKNDYFNWINASAAPTFEKLLQIATDHRQSLPDIVTAVNASEDTKFLARSIVLLWYLGSWYRPDDLKKNATPGARALIPSQVVSAKAYTLGLIWQIAQAHPMGYSNLQFGYWSREPADPNGKPPLAFITDRLP
jgi:small-conductance mechanosensitive channel